MIINDLDGYYIVFDTKNWNTELDTLFIYIVEMQRTLFNGINKTLLSKTSAEKSLSLVI